MTGVAPKLVYSSEYDIHFGGLEKLHPFDGRKYSRAWRVLEEAFREQLSNFLVPLTRLGPREEHQDLAAVHSESYLEQLKSNRYVAQAIELPFLAALSVLDKGIMEKRILEPMRWATRGTLVAAATALRSGLAVNLGGGYHHASQNRGEGFCIYADIAVAVSKLRRKGKLGEQARVLIIDLDAHQGNGLQRVFYKDRSVYFFDMFNEEIYPGDGWARKRIDFPFPLSSGTDDEQYLGRLEGDLPEVLRRIEKPSIAFYIAGTDIYQGDQLGSLAVSANGIFRRDRFVLESLVNEQIPCVMVLGGGYSKESYRLVARTVQHVLQTWGFDGSGPRPHDSKK